MSGDLQPGQLVRSIAGRDKGHWLIIKGIVDDKFVQVVDGNLRPLKTPKKKNKKHLQLTEKVDEKLHKSFAAGSASDQDVKETLSRLLKDTECNP